MHPCVRCVSKLRVRCVASRPYNIAVSGGVSDGGESRVPTRLNYDSGCAPKKVNRMRTENWIG